jgi:sec-independent protein translocase protein TatA
MFGLGPTELIVIAVILLLLFGAKRLPDIGKGVGGAIREFRKVKGELSRTGPASEDEGNKKGPTKIEMPSTLEGKVADKFMDQVPAVKKVVEAKKKVEKIKEVLK